MLNIQHLFESSKKMLLLIKKNQEAFHPLKTWLINFLFMSCLIIFTAIGKLVVQNQAISSNPQLFSGQLSRLTGVAAGQQVSKQESTRHQDTREPSSYVVKRGTENN